MLKLADIEQPHNLEAERALLGSLMLDTDQMLNIGAIDRDCFYNTTHQYIWEAIHQIFEKKEELDTITIMHRLEFLNYKDVQLEYVANLPDTVPLSSNASKYADILRDYAKRRNLMRLSVEVINNAGTLTNTPDEISSEYIEKLEGVIKLEEKPGGLVSSRKATDKVLDSIEEAFNRRADGDFYNGMPTGYHQMDEILGFLAKDTLTIIGARPGQGKSVMGLDIVEASSALSKRPVGFFSCEMSSDEIGMRRFNQRTGIAANRLRLGNLTDTDFVRIGSATGDLFDTNVFIDDTPHLSIAHIRNQIKEFNYRHVENLGMVVVDYVQLMKTSGNKQRYEAIGELTAELKRMAKEFHIPIVALAQISREVESRKGKKQDGSEDCKPVLGDLRESGNIEQDADNVIFIWNNKPDEGGSTRKGYFLVAKNRNGAAGKEVSVIFIKEYLTFKEITTLGDLPDHVRDKLANARVYPRDTEGYVLLNNFVPLNK